MLSPEPGPLVADARQAETTRPGRGETLEGGGAEAKARGNQRTRRRPPAWVLQRQQEERDRYEDEAAKARLLGLPPPARPGSKASRNGLDQAFESHRQRQAAKRHDDIPF